MHSACPSVALSVQKAPRCRASVCVLHLAPGGVAERFQHRLGRVRFALYFPVLRQADPLSRQHNDLTMIC